MKSFIITLVLFISIFQSGISQQFEIRAVNAGGGIISIEMRETSGTTPTSSDFVTDITFGIKWSTSYNVDLETVDNSAGYNIVKSGTRMVDGSFHFQAFGANSTPYMFPSNWTTNEWIEIMSISNSLNGTVEFGTFEIVETGFDVTTDPNFGFNLVDYTPVINGMAVDVQITILLDVDLKSFSAQAQKNSILLYWESLSETNFEGYELQRSRSSAGVNFNKIAWVLSNGNSSIQQEYNFEDVDVKTDIDYYYRLKMIDLDGSFDYSEIRTAILKNDKEGVISVYPNPTTNYVTVKGKVTPNSILSIHDAIGKEIFTMQLTTEYVQNDIDLSNLSSGSYHLKITTLNNQILYSESLIIH